MCRCRDSQPHYDLQDIAHAQFQFCIILSLHKQASPTYIFHFKHIWYQMIIRMYWEMTILFPFGIIFSMIIHSLDISYVNISVPSVVKKYKQCLIKVPLILIKLAFLYKFSLHSRLSHLNPKLCFFYMYLELWVCKLIIMCKGYFIFPKSVLNKSPLLKIDHTFRYQQNGLLINFWKYFSTAYILKMLQRWPISFRMIDWRMWQYIIFHFIP